MDRLPARGPAVRALGLTLPPERMPMWRRARLLKRWRYLGIYGPRLMLCVGDARIGPIPQRWWAVAEPDGALRQATSLRQGGVRMEGSTVEVDSDEVGIRLTLSENLHDPAEVEVATPVGDRGNYVWTRKRAGVPVVGTVRVAGHEHEIEGEAFVDESAGYYPRHTVWKWSAGRGIGQAGERVAWNLVTGVHDSPEHSERTLWVDGRQSEVGAVRFADDLSGLSFAEGGGLEFAEWSAREERMNLLLLRSTYRQPFGTFAGELPGGIRLAEGYGVMEEHDVLW